MFCSNPSENASACRSLVICFQISPEATGQSVKRLADTPEHFSQQLNIELNLILDLLNGRTQAGRQPLKSL